MFPVEIFSTFYRDMIIFYHIFSTALSAPQS
nr:MAG TPA: hypothetical protein [Caudoviricetes sp.]